MQTTMVSSVFVETLKIMGIALVLVLLDLAIVLGGIAFVFFCITGQS